MIEKRKLCLVGEKVGMVFVNHERRFIIRLT